MVRLHISAGAGTISVSNTQLFQEILIKGDTVVHVKHVVALVTFYFAIYNINGHAEAGCTALCFICSVRLPFANHHIVGGWFAGIGCHPKPDSGFKSYHRVGFYEFRIIKQYLFITEYEIRRLTIVAVIA